MIHEKEFCPGSNTLRLYEKDILGNDWLAKL